MSENNVALNVEHDADVTIISIATARIPADLSDAFEQNVARITDPLEKPKVLLDFAGVTFISSAILGKLIKLNGRLTDRGGQLKLSTLAPRIAEVFHITGLDRLFAIYESRDDAVKAFD